MIKYFKVKKDTSPINPSGIDGLIDTRTVDDTHLLIVVDQDLVIQQLTDAKLSLPVEVAAVDVITECGTSSDDILNGVS